MKKYLTILFILFCITANATKKYYYVAGNGNGNFSDNANWYNGTGGTGGGTTFPTNVDTAYLDAGSGTGICNLNANASIKALLMSGFAGTLAGSGNILAYGSVYLAGTLTANGSLNFYGTGTVNFNGKTWLSSLSVVAGAGTVTFADDVTFKGITWQHNSGTMSWGTSTLTYTGANRLTFTGNGQTYYNFTYSPTSESDGLVMSGANTFNNVTINSVYSGVFVWTTSANLVINGSLVLTGKSTNLRMQVWSSLLGTTRTITYNGASPVTLSKVDFLDIKFAGTGTWTGGYHIGNMGGCDISVADPFTPARILVWRNAAGSGNWSDSLSWNVQHVWGTPASIPLPQDSVRFDASSITAGSKTITMDARNLSKGINMGDSLLNNPTVTFNGVSNYINIFGDVTFINFTRAGTAVFEWYGSRRTDPYNMTISGVTMSNNFEFYTVGKKYIVTTGFTNTGKNWATYNSSQVTFNNINVTTGSMIFASGTIDLGSGTITLTGTSGTVFTAGSVQTSNLSTIKLTGTPSNDITFAGGGKSYGTVWFNPSTPKPQFKYAITGANTFTTLTFDAGISVQLPSSTIETVTNLTTTGTSGNYISIFPSLNTAVATISISSGTVNFDYCNIMGITVQGGATFNMNATCFDGGGTTGFTKAWTPKRLVSAYTYNASNATDALSYANLTTSGVTYAAGIKGNGAVFGASGRMYSGNTSTYPSGNYTIIMWVKSSGFGTTNYSPYKTATTNTSTINATNLGTNGTSGYVRCINAVGDMFSPLSSGSAVLSSTQWNLVGLTTNWQNLTASTFYCVNGTVVNPATSNVTYVAEAGSSLLLGCSSTTVNYYVGSMDEVSFYNGIVTPAFFKNEYSYRKGFLQ